MILVFLGSWRSTIIVAMSIPLSVLVVDHLPLGDGRDAERDDARRPRAGRRHSRRRRDGRDREHPSQHRARESRCDDAIVDGAEQIAIPAFVSTLSICIVFLPIFALSGPAAALFRPLALAVIFAMAASYFLSRTLVPTMADYMLPGEAASITRRSAASTSRRRRFKTHHRAIRPRLRAVPRRLSRDARVGDGASPASLLGRRGSVRARVAAARAGDRRGLLPAGGRRTVPAARPRAVGHAPRGDRAALRERRAVDAARDSGERTFSSMLDNIGLTTLRRLARDRLERDRRAGGRRHARAAHAGAQRLDVGLRSPAAHASCRRSIPGVTFFFQPADMVNQVLNLGLPAPIDVQVVGRNRARQLRRRAASSPQRDRADSRRGGRARAAGDGRAGAALRRRPHQGAADRPLAARRRERPAHLARRRADRRRRTSGSIPRNGVQYAVNVMTPQYKMGTVDALHEHADHRRRARRRRSSSATSRRRAAARRAGGRESLQRAAGVRRLRQRRPPRPRRRRARDRPDHREGAGRRCRAARTIDDARAGAEHARLVHRSRARASCSRSCSSTSFSSSTSRAGSIR